MIRVTETYTSIERTKSEFDMCRKRRAQQKTFFTNRLAAEKCIAKLILKMAMKTHTLATILKIYFPVTMCPL